MRPKLRNKKNVKNKKTKVKKLKIKNVKYKTKVEKNSNWTTKKDTIVNFK
jgi:hypothetical protein